MPEASNGGCDVLIVGSSSVDISISVSSIPRPGETIITPTQSRGRGGKGANQAHAAARAGAKTGFIGSVGEDESGDYILEALHESGVDTAGTRRTEMTSGTAYVIVEESGENAIVVVSASNWTFRDVSETEKQIIRKAPVVLMQLEIPVPTVAEVAAVAKEAGGFVILNAAPYAPLPDELLANIDLLMVNETEAEQLADMQGTPEAFSAKLSAMVPQVLITLGSKGSLFSSAETGLINFAAPKVKATDTTAAGDTFAGAYAAAIVDGQTPQEALKFASSAAALAVQRKGAVESVPYADEIAAAVDGFYGTE